MKDINALSMFVSFDDVTPSDYQTEAEIDSFVVF